ncbi:MAG: transposase [Candidatus Rokuibacteriota bacterium]
MASTLSARQGRALERTLIETFHRARWQESGGTPVCPECFDWHDVRPDLKNRQYRPNLRMYLCTCCDRRFTDLYESPLHHTKAPLLQWAIALLLPPLQKYAALPRAQTGIARATLTTMQARLHGTPTAARWTQELAGAGITVEQLIAAILKRRQS